MTGARTTRHLPLCTMSYSDRGIDADPRTSRPREPWWLGRAFAFYRPIDAEPFATDNGHHVIFLGSPEGCTVGDLEDPVEIAPRQLTLPALHAVCTDKEVYRANVDVVHVLVWSDGATGPMTLELERDGSPVVPVEVDLGKRGLGVARVAGLAPGRWEVRGPVGSARFTVAAFRQAPLHVQWEGVEVAPDGTSVGFGALLDVFGVAVEGQVKVTLVDASGEQDPLELRALDGRVEGVLSLPRHGAWSARFSTPARGAEAVERAVTVPIPGMRRGGMAPLVLCAWHETITARSPTDALRGGAASQLVRGLLLETSDGADVPVRVSADGRAVELVEDVDAWRVVVVDPATGKVEEQAGGPSPGGASIPVGSYRPWSLVMVGVRAGDWCWEGRAALLQSPAESVGLVVPDVVEPDGSLRIDLNGPPGADAVVVVRDERALANRTLDEAAGAALHRQVRAGLELGGEGQVEVKLRTALVAERAGAGPATPPAAPSAPEPSDYDQLPTRDDFPEVLAVRQVALDHRGLLGLDVHVPGEVASVVVEVFVSDGRDWSTASALVRVHKPVYGELELPRYVALGDHVVGALYVHLVDRPAEVTMFRDRQPVQMRSGSERGTVLQVRPPGATVRFLAQPGSWTATIFTGERSEMVQGEVDEPGRAVWAQRALTLLSAGSYLDRSADGSILDLRLLADVSSVIDDLAEALGRFHGSGPEIASARAVAHAVRLTRSAGAESASAARAELAGALRSVQQRLIPGQGYRDEDGEVSRMSAVVALDILLAQSLLAEVRSTPSVLGAAVAAANEVLGELGLGIAPEHPRSAREAWLRSQLHLGERLHMADWVRDRIAPWRSGHAVADTQSELGALGLADTPAAIRRESAFGAAVLLDAGGQFVHPAISLVNSVMSAVRADGGLHSTVDSVAAVVMLLALQRARLSCERCHVNGEIMTRHDAVAISSRIERVGPMDGVLAVLVQRVVQEDFVTLDGGVEARVELLRGGRPLEGFLHPGDAVDLRVTIGRWRPGDLVDVFLPDALSWVHGGDLVKRFQVRVAEEAAHHIPLIATGLTQDAEGRPAAHRFAVAVRNAYDERRGKGLGEIEVTVAPHGAEPKAPEPGVVQRWWQSLKGIIS